MLATSHRFIIGSSLVALAMVAVVPVTGSAQDTPDGGVDAGASALVPPQISQFVEAEYPTAAREAGLEANVELEITIDATGAVTEARVVTPAGHGFDEAALEAVNRFVFEPARRGGAAIPSRIRYRYVFELREATTPPTETGETETEPTPPPPGRLEGRVVSRDDGDSVREAEVVVTSSDGETNRRVLTSRRGRFRVDDLPPGTYAVRIFANEYGEHESTEEIATNEITDVTYRLDLLRDPNEFSATARIPAPPREVIRRTISREELTRIPGTRGDALRTVELLPGVGRPPFSAGQLIVRGSSPQDSQVFLDSAPVPLLYHFGGLTSFYNSRMLEQIDFVPGNFSARYGRKIGGILEVTTRDPARDAFHGVADINIIDASLIVEAPISDEVSVSLAGRRSYIDFFFQNVVPKDLFDVVTAPVYYDYQSSLSWRPSDVDRVRFSVYGSSDALSLVFAEPQGDDPNIRGNFDLTTQFHRFYASWTRKLSRDVTQDVQFVVGPNMLNFAFGPNLKFDATFVQMNGRAEWRARLSPRVQINAGLDIDVIPFQLDFRGPPIGGGEGNGPSDTCGSTACMETNDISSSGVAVRPAVYVESALEPIDPLRLVVGLRLDYYKEIGRWTFDPRIASILSVDTDNRIKLGVGMYSQPPEFQESSAQLGNPDLLPLHAVHTGLGYEHDFGEGITVGVEGFYKYLFDRVVSTQGGVAPRYENTGTGNIYGLEVSGRVNPQGRRWFGFLSYTLMRSERRDRDGEAFRLFDYDQTHILSIAAVYRLGDGWEAGATFRLVSGNPTTPIGNGTFSGNTLGYQPIAGATNSTRNPLFHRLDLRVEKQFEIGDSFKLAVYLDVQNVYNSTNQEGVIYDYRYRTSAALQGLPIIPSLGVRGEL